MYLVSGFKALSDREAAAIAPKPTAAEVAAPAPIAQAAMPVTPSQETSRQLVASDDCIAILEEVQSKVEPFVQV